MRHAASPATSPNYRRYSVRLTIQNWIFQRAAVSRRRLALFIKEGKPSTWPSLPPFSLSSSRYFLGTVETSSVANLRRAYCSANKCAARGKKTPSRLTWLGARKRFLRVAPGGKAGRNYGQRLG
jgi:hypothetical protein